MTPNEFIDVKALMGDQSDNIPGVPSIGEKTATALISAWHSIENAYDHIDEIRPPRAQKALREHYDMAQFSKWLATIRTDVPVNVTLEDIRLAGFGGYICDALALLARDEGVPYAEWLAAIAANPIARAVKLADLRDEMDISRLSELEQADRELYRENALACRLLTGEAIA